MALLFLKGVSGQQAHTPNSAGPVEDRTPPERSRAPLERHGGGRGSAPT